MPPSFTLLPLALASVRGLPCTVEFEGMPGIFGTIIFITAFAPANRA